MPAEKPADHTRTPPESGSAPFAVLASLTEVAAEKMSTALRELPAQVRELSATAPTRIAALQRKVEAYRADAETTYADLADRARRLAQEYRSRPSGSSDGTPPQD